MSKESFKEEEDSPADLCNQKIRRRTVVKSRRLLNVKEKVIIRKKKKIKKPRIKVQNVIKIVDMGRKVPKKISWKNIYGCILCDLCASFYSTDVLEL